MNPQNRLMLERRFEFAERARLEPSIIDRFLCRKCEVRVLVVADSFLYFNDEDFGLSDFVSILETASHTSAKLSVDRAHRNDPGDVRLNGADKNFVFTKEALARYDVVFMFAASRSDTLSTSELQALAEFMDDGGGVFATGDHEDLGRGMCGDLMRVRSMRKWFWPSDGPMGEPRAPDGSTADRHDTNRPGTDAAFTFDDQSDVVPQTISPVLYRVASTFLATVSEPHPLLCGPEGVIDVLPDHPHEGDCIEPWEVDRVFDYAGTEFVEYPDGPDGTAVLPEVIATSSMIPGAETETKPPVPGGTFGAISAYDGHLADGRGRVVCDATWHHFININLTGTAFAPVGDPKREGFLATPEGEAVFERIKAYFRNIAFWSAPPAKQRCMSRRWFWNVLRLPKLREQLRPAKAAALSVPDLIEAGRAVSLLPPVDASRCQSRRFHFEIIEPPFREIREFRELIPCGFPSPRPCPDPSPFADGEAMRFAMLGGAAMAVLEDMVARERDPKSQPVDDDQIGDVAKKGVVEAMGVLRRDMQAAVERLGDVAVAMEGAR